METLRKIELQEPKDLVYLIQTVRSAATAQLNEAFPPVEGHDGHGDELRLRIEREVHEYINRTFRLALPNITINGLDVPTAQFLAPLRSSSDDPAASDPLAIAAHEGPSSREPIVVFEPFDNSKRNRVEDLCREEEDLLNQIAALKRKVPSSVASGFRNLAAETLKADDEALAELVDGIVRQAAAGGAAAIANGNDGRSIKNGGGAPGAANGRRQQQQVSTIDVQPLERQADTERAFEDAVSGLVRLTGDMPAAVAKMDRARVAGEYVITKR